MPMLQMLDNLQLKINIDEVSNRHSTPSRSSRMCLAE
jgi:hypothetical protein